MPNDPSLDPLRTGDLAPPPDSPSTVGGTGAYQPAGATTPHAPAPPPGAPTIPGYQITREIARGGMGRVYAGRDLSLDREVALKTLLPGADAKRFVTEAKITARLPHPGIPPVHGIGALDDGSPYLAMKLIHGRTLAEELKGRPPHAEGLSRFVQIFEQVAQAVGFAHAHGILHRDLKPLNVMVGELGEVQVMDWGLAKDLSDRDRPAGAAALTALPEGHTRAGTVMGTPGYMAPEQARGEPVDARADVFALGSILAVILTGQPAVVGKTPREAIDKAACADLAAVAGRLGVCGADAALVALSLRCLAARAEDRPADGREVAAEVAAYRAGVEARLRRAETERAEALVREAEQRKRRRALLVAAGAVAAVLLAGLGTSLWQMKRAIDAEGVARDNERRANVERDAKAKALEAETQARDQAFAALRTMTEEVVERKFAQGVTLTKDDRAFLRNVIRQYDAFAAVTGDDAESRAIRAEGRARVGVVRERLGEFKEAVASLEEALVLHKQLAAEFPGRYEFRRALAVSHNNRGNLRRAAGRLKEAEADHDTALAIRKQLADDFPGRYEFRQALAASHYNRALLRSTTGRLKDAEADYDAALAIQKRLVADFPDRPDYRQELSRSHNNRGLLLSATGRLKEAEAEHDAALTQQQRLAADSPDRPEFRQDLAASHYNRGLLRSTTGRLKDAEADYDAALALRRRLAADFPGRPEFRQELAKSHNNRGLLLRATGRLEEARADLTEGVALRKQLTADFPDRPEFRQELAVSLNNRGNLLSASGRTAEARADYDEALTVQKQLVADFPGRPEFRLTLARNLNNRGNLLRVTGRLEEAGADHAEALALRKQLAAAFPNRPDLQNDLAGTYVQLALLGNHRGDFVAAKAFLQLGRPHHEAALKANPRHPDYRQFYHSHLRALAHAHAGLLEPAEAVRVTRARRDIGWSPPADAFDAAVILGQCLPIVEQHARLDAGRRQEAAKYYGDESMGLLRQAVEMGFRDAKRLQAEPAFAPLRSRPDWPRLLASLGQGNDE